MISDLIQEAKRLTGKPESSAIQTILHPGSRGAQGFVTFFFYSEGQPFCLAKVARTDNALIQREADNLTLVQAQLEGSQLKSRVDRVLGMTECEGRLVVFKEWRPGGPASQLVATGKAPKVTAALEACTSWLLQFIEATSAAHIVDPAIKRQAATKIASSADEHWIDVFVASETCFLGPAHGDLVPANVLLHQGQVSTVVDFENFDIAGFPYADFVGLIVSIGQTAFGDGSEMIENTFRAETWLSSEVARQVQRYCQQTGSSIIEFVDLLPLYSDRALTIARTWELTEQLELQTQVRDFFVTNKQLLQDRLGAVVKTTDVLMITFNAPAYVKISLERVFDSCDDNTRIWLWHNGMHEEMLDMVTDYAKDPRVHRFHHSVENVRLTDPTNWLWSESDGDFVSKVDDDCLLPVDWITRLKAAHAAAPNANFGAIGASRLRPEDIEPEHLEKKIGSYEGGIQLFRNHWVQGSGYLMPRNWVEQGGLLRDGESWTNHCLAMAQSGAVNGFLYPLMFEDHMDDPRSEHTLMKSDADLEWRMPLSITRNKITDLESWEGRMRRSAHSVQTASLDLRSYRGWRRKLSNQQDKLRKFLRP